SPAQAAALRGARSTTDIPDTALESHWLYITTGRELPYGTVRSLQARDLVSSPRTVWVELPDEYVGLETFPLTDTGREVLAALQGEDAAEDPADDAAPDDGAPAPEADQHDADESPADVAFIRVYHCADGGKWTEVQSAGYPSAAAAERAAAAIRDSIGGRTRVVLPGEGAPEEARAPPRTQKGTRRGPIGEAPRS